MVCKFLNSASTLFRWCVVNERVRHPTLSAGVYRCQLAGRRDLLLSVLSQQEVDYLSPIYSYTRFKTKMPLQPDRC